MLDSDSSIVPLHILVMDLKMIDERTKKLQH